VDSTIDSVDINGKAAEFEVSAGKTAIIGNVADKAAGGTLTVNYDAANAATVVLNGTKYNQGGAAASLVFDFKGKASTLKFSGADATFTGTIQNTAGAASNKGTVQISANTTLHNTVFAALGAGNEKVDIIEVDAGTTLTLSGTTDTANLARGVSLTSGGALKTLTQLELKDTAKSNNITLAQFTALVLNGGTEAKVIGGNGANTFVHVKGNASLEAGNAFVQDLVFKDTSTLTLTGNSGFKNIIVDAAKAGTIKPAGKTLTVENFGTKENKLTLNFEDVANGALVVTGKEFHGDVIVNSGKTFGQVTFTDALVIDGIIGNSTGVVSKVLVSGANANVNFGDSLKSVDTLEFNHADAKAEISSVGTKLKVDAAAGGGQGQLTLSNEKEIIFASIGANNQIGKLIVKGANVTVEAAAKIGSLEFSEGDKEITFAALDLNNIKGYVTKNKNVAIGFKDNSTLQADLGTKDNSFFALGSDGTQDATLNLNGKNTFSAIVGSKVTEKLTVTGVGANGANTTYGQFGAILEGKTYHLKSLELAATGANNTTTITGPIYSNEIKNAAGIAKVKFEKSIHGKDANSTFTLTNNAHELTFAHGAGIENMKVVAAAAGNGKLTFEGSTNIGEIGGKNNVADVIFADKKGSDRVLAGDINSTNIELGAGSYGIEKSLKFTGATTVKADAEIALGEKVKLETVAVTVAGKAKIKMHTSAQLTGAASALTTPQNLTINVVNDTLASGDVNTAFITYQNFGNLVKTNAANTLPTLSQGRLFNYSLEQVDANTAKLVAKADTDRFVKDVSDAKASETAVALAKALTEDTKSLTGSAKQLMTMLDNVETTAATVTDSLQRIAAAPQTAEVSFGVVSAAMDHVNTRSSVVGVGAGDENSGINLGVWGEGFASRATQKARKGDAGFKVNSGGATVGVDAMVSDRTVLGLAATYSASTVKFQDQKSGDKAKLTNMMFSVYGTHDLGNSWFVRGIAGFGTGSIKSDAQRVTGNGTKDVASAKYDSLAFSFEGGVGYDYKLTESTSLVPALALRYTNVNEGGFTEKGSKFNRTVTKKSADKITGIFGASVLSSMDLNGSVVTPEAHAYVNYDLKSKKPKIDVKLDGLSKAIDVTGAKLEKLSYNLGTSLTARSGAVEYGAGYDARLASKYVSHQGTLKVKVDL
jgi:outer membrane autotransporter protein